MRCICSNFCIIFLLFFPLWKKQGDFSFGISRVEKYVKAILYIVL